MRLVCLILSFGLPGLAQVDPEYVFLRLLLSHAAIIQRNSGQPRFGKHERLLKRHNLL